MTVKIQVVDHPTLGSTRKAIALTCNGKRVFYIHNDLTWHDWGRICCPKRFLSSVHAETYITDYNLRGTA